MWLVQLTCVAKGGRKNGTNWESMNVCLLASPRLREGNRSMIPGDERVGRRSDHGSNTFGKAQRRCTDSFCGWFGVERVRLHVDADQISLSLGIQVKGHL